MRERAGAPGKFDVVFTSQRAVRTQEPRWPLVKVSLNDLCFGERDRTICIQVVSPNGKNWGTTRPMSVNDLLKPEAMIQLHPNLVKFNVLSGQIQVREASIFERPSFTDYLRSGWQIALSVAIDFTESNKDPSNPDSLHHLDETKN